MYQSLNHSPWAPRSSLSVPSRVSTALSALTAPVSSPAVAAVAIAAVLHRCFIYF